MEKWKFVDYIQENKECRLDGLNIWNHYWNCTDRKVEVRCPHEGQVYFFKEYKINDGDKEVTFVAGEFSDERVGLYLKDDPDAQIL